MANSFSSSNLGNTSKELLNSIDLKHKMDALVSDLSHALDESQLPQYHKKKRGYKRRSKTGNSLGLSICNRIKSEDSSSSVGGMTMSQDNKSSIPISDSDELSPPPDPRMHTPHLTHHRIPQNLVESDSVNENFSPARLHNRRKQKCKRMALDPDIPSTSACHNVMDRACLSSFRKKKLLSIRPDTDNRSVEFCAGKRKRGNRNMDWEHLRRTGRTRHTTGNHTSKYVPSTVSHNKVDHMDFEYSESNSTDSDTGIYTCEEGREADDEQSDWFAEPGAVYGVPGAGSSARNQNQFWWNEESFAKVLFKDKYDRMSQESLHACRLRFQKLRERLLRREIRAGRRRIQERRPGFSIISSVNDKVSKFLQDPEQVELKLKPMTERDVDQLMHLAKLYSLEVIRGEGDQSAPIVIKTRKTITPTQLDCFTSSVGMGEGSFPGGTPVPVSDIKRRRRSPPPSINNLTEGSNDSVESVIISAGNRPPVPTASWEEDDDISERLADSEPDPIPSPSSLPINDCKL